MSHPIKYRFVSSLISNIFRSGINFTTSLLVARVLGPGEFGRMSFLLASFAAVKGLMDLGSSSAFFTFLSQRQRSRKFIFLYWKWIACQFFFALLVVGLLLPAGWVKHIWQGESRVLVVLALVAAFMQGSVWPIASQMAEAQRKTVRVQWLNTLAVASHLIVVLILWWFGKIGITVLLAAVGIEWFVASWFSAKMYDDVPETAAPPQARAETTRTIYNEFLKYCIPFIPYVIFSFIYEFGDRWMLQNWGGSREQSYYAVAYQFAAVALLATSSILRIFWKEIAEAHHLGNIERVRMLYKKVSRGLYFVAAIVAGWALPWTAEIIQLTLGNEYVKGTATMMLMFFYPMHQSMGQIGGTMLYATGKTRVQALMGILFMASSSIVTYFLLAPANAMIPGFGLASLGLGWKMVVMQIIYVNILSYIISRIFKWKFDWLYQFISVILVVAAGWSVKFILGAWAGPVIPKMIVSGMIYSVCIAGILFWLPWLAGVEKAELLGAYHKVSKFIRRRA